MIPANDDQDTLTAARCVAERMAQIYPLLSDLPPRVQGAILADLTATYIAGHFVADNARETRKLRDSLYRAYCQMVRRLVGCEPETRSEPPAT